jgi:hypothetical protein
VIVLFAPPGEGATSPRQEAVTAANRALKTEVCAKRGLRLCVDVASHEAAGRSPAKAIGRAVTDAMGRHAVLRASTQRGR